MYLWRCLIALTLGLFSYFWDSGLFIMQSVVCLLCFLPRTNVFINILHEISTQTDQLPEETLNQDDGEDEYFCCGDELDAVNVKQELAEEAQCSNVKRSLQQVFECAYSQFILTWYSVPEPMDSQPLYKALGSEFDLLVDRVISRTSDINVCAVGVDCVRILTQHLHNAKQSDRAQLFSSRADEMAVLRVFSEGMVRSFFPDSLTAQDLTRCALNEIIALKGLELLVNWLSDPDNLNQLVVSQLDAMILMSSMDELQELKREDTPSSMESEDREVMAEDLEDLQPKPKKKGAKFKERFSKLVDSMKPKETKRKQKKKSKEKTTFRSLETEAVQSDTDDDLVASCNQNQRESNSDDSDLESSPLTVQEDRIEFKLSYEMWRISSWAVSVQQVQEEGEELSFTICLKEINNPEKLHWDVRKSQADLRQFHCSLRDAADLPSVSEVLESTERPMNEQFKEEARAKLETFLQELVKDSQLGQSQEVFQFLCPLERLLTEEESYGGVWSLLSGLAYILAPAQGEEEDVGAQGPAKPDGPDTEGAEPEGAADAGDGEADPEGSREELTWSTANLRCGRPADSVDGGKIVEEEPELQATGLPVTHSPEDEGSARESHSGRGDGGKHSSTTDGPCFPFRLKPNKKDNKFHKIPVGIHNRRGKGKTKAGMVEERREQELNRREVNQTGKEQQEAIKAIIDLLKEISGNSVFVIICDILVKTIMSLLKKTVKNFLDKMNLTEAQMASYIDRLREKQWPGGVPAVSGPGRTDEQKSETKERAHQLINTRCSKLFILKKCDVETVFNIFQDTGENKKLVYMLLSCLLKELMPRESSLNVKAIAFLNSPV